MRIDRRPPHRQIAEDRDRRLVQGTAIDWGIEGPGALLMLMRTWFGTDATSRSEPIHQVLQLVPVDPRDPDTAVLRCGARKERWFQRRDGLRCHFQMVLRRRESTWRVVSYSFQVDQPEAQPLVPGSPAYVRYDYTAEPQSDPVSHPLCHLTPGNKSLRLPAAPLTPKELASWYLSLEPW